MGRFLALLGTVVVIGCAAPASADPEGAFDDTGFLTTVRDAGLTYTSPDRAIAFGKQVCGWIGSGKSGSALVRNLQDENPGLTTVHATLFVAISAKYYCPQQLTATH